MSHPSFQPTDEQRAVLEHHGPLLVLAGAGGGKTTVLTQRVASMITKDGIHPTKILALTFTHAAADEMQTRIIETLEEQGCAMAGNQVVVHTYHGSAGEIVREFGLRLGLAPNARPMSKAEQWTVLDEVYDALTFREVAFRQPGTAFQNILKFAANAQAHLLTPSDIATYIDQIRAVGIAPEAEALLNKWADMSRAFAAYQTRKLETGRIDYGDQIVHAVQLLRDTPQIQAALQTRHPYVFVDEYQDTNLAQQELVLNLIKTKTSQLFVIGDDDQAIFRFQGANIENIRQLPHEPILADDPLALKTLVGNRRSQPPILDVANRVVEKIANRQDKQLTHLRTGRATVGAYVANTDHDEAEWIASMIKTLRSTEGPHKPVQQWGDIAVLCRRHADIDRVHEALTLAGIPCVRARPTPLLERSEVDEIRAILETLVAPTNDVAVTRVLTAPRWKLTEADLWALAQYRHHHRTAETEIPGDRYIPRPPLIDTVLNPANITNLSPEARARLETLAAELHVLTEIAQRSSVDDTVRAVLTHGRYRDEYAVGLDIDHREALNAIDRFVHLARSFGGRGLYGLRSFLRFLDRADESDDHELNDPGPATIDPEHVMLTTVHSAKGLEWSVVFVYGLATHRSSEPGEDHESRTPYPLRAGRSDLPEFPDSAFTTAEAFISATKARDHTLKTRKLDDERRLLYVALTRARNYLYVSRAHWYGTRKTPCKPSPFWDDILGPDCPLLGEEPASAANPSLTHPPPPIAGAKTQTTATAEQIEHLLANDDLDAAVALAMNGEAVPDTWRPLRDALIADLHRDFSHPPTLDRTDDPDIHSTSYTAINSFQICPRRFRHLFIDQLPTRPSPSRDIGSALHRLLARTGEAGGDTVIHDDDSVRGDLDLVLADNPELLDRYAKSRWSQRPASHVEVKFALPIGHHVIRGAIDRVDVLPNGTFEIADFKSGRRRPLVALENDLQLPIYALAAEEIFDVQPAQIQASFCYLGDGNDWTLPWSQTHAAATRTRLEQTLDAMTTSAFPKTEDRSKCRFCDFAHVCER